MSSGGGPDAFTFVTVAYDLPDRIESICPWQDRVYAGLADGSVVVLEPEFELHEDGPWSVTQRVKGVGKRAITQMEPVAQLPALFVLSTAGLQLLELPSLRPLTQVPVNGAPFRFAWNESASLLCVAVRKTLTFYKLEGIEFIETNTVLITDTVRVMAWCGGSLCYGSRARYVFVEPSSGQLTESIAVGRGNTVMTPLQGNEILLVRDSTGVYVKSDGNLARNVTINWSQVPQAVVLCEPFVVGLLDNFMEVRNVSPTARQCVIQMFNDVDRINISSLFTAVDKSVFMASSVRRTVCRLNPVPLKQQIDTLIKMKEFQDALQVVELLDEEGKTAKEDDIRVSYGVDLFMNKEYNEGLMQFMMRSKRTPLLLLKLFPSLLPREMLESFSLPVSEEYFADYVEPVDEDYAFAVSCLLPLLLADRTRLESKKIEDMEEDAIAQSRLKSIQEDEKGDEDAADVSTSEVAARSGPEKLKSRATRARLTVLVDTAIMKAMLISPDSGTLLQFVKNKNSIDLVEGERSLKSAGRYLELSALYQSHGLHDIGLETLRVLSLEPSKLEVPPRGAASDLHGLTGVWAAVRYLSKLTVADAAVIQKHSRWVLQKDPESAIEVFVGAADPLPPSVVLPILDQHAPHYSAVYLEAVIEKGAASREDHDKTLVHIYLKEAMVNEKKLGQLYKQADEVERFDFAKMNEVSQKRLLQKDAVFERSGDLVYEDVEKAKDAPEFCKSLKPPTPLESYTRLRELLIESPYIDPKSVLDSIPIDALLELRALLMERNRSYKSALHVYVKQLHDLELAEKLCDRVHEMEKSTSADRMEDAANYDVSEHTANVYMAMIRTYLEPEEGSADEKRHLTDDEWKNLCSLLCRKRYRIDIADMFSLLPEDVELGVLQQFIEGALRTLAEQQRSLLIVNSLYTSENLYRREEYIQCKQRSVTVSYESVCCICRKRISNAVFVVYPNGTLAHLACYTRQSKTESEAQPLQPRSGFRSRWDR